MIKQQLWKNWMVFPLNGVRKLKVAQSSTNLCQVDRDWEGEQLEKDLVQLDGDGSLLFIFHTSFLLFRWRSENTKTESLSALHTLPNSRTSKESCQVLVQFPQRYQAGGPTRLNIQQLVHDWFYTYRSMHVFISDKDIFVIQLFVGLTWAVVLRSRDVRLPVDAHHHSVVSLIGLQSQLFLWLHVLSTHLLHFRSKNCLWSCCGVYTVGLKTTIKRLELHNFTCINFTWYITYKHRNLNVAE